ncbi:MAG: hypothetical protein HYV35_11900 [Lentisphaerae bacterium]|nr:hypothetical protein [Lentisphaerota bacterium]
MKKTIGFVFSHTHWDVEWFLPMRSYRFWLVELLERLIRDCAPRRDFRTFVLDGQVAPVEHYLALKPEKAPAIRRLVRAGKLAIGPFYTQFDEWLNSPEAIVRNCLHGQRQGRRLGRIMRAGYLPDNFGHPRQLPQILAGFELDNFIFMRGMPDKPRGMQDEFYWEGLDGTRVLCVHLGGSRSGYGSAMLLNRAADFTRLPHTTPYGDIFCGYESLAETTVGLDIDKCAQKLIDVARALRHNHPSGVVPLANGMDHVPPMPQIGEIISTANRRQSDIRFVQGDCAELVARVKKTTRKLPVFKGELWGARYHYLLTGTLTTRTYLKQANFQAEALLEKYAEPLGSLAAIHGQPYPEKLLQEAWGLLFLNQAHDSIHGSSVDPVHLEMEQRFEATRQIANGICHYALEHLGPLLAPMVDGRRRQIVAYNPVSAGNRDRLVELFVRAPNDDFHIEDQAGRSVPLQIVKNTPAPFQATHRVLFLAPARAPALAAFTVVPGRAPASAPLKASRHQIENEFLRVIFRKGRLEFYDKVAGRSFYNLNILEDEADAGDAWDFSPPRQKNRIYRSSEFLARCRLIEAGPLRATLLIETLMRVPRSLSGQKRSLEQAPLKIATRVSLLRGARRVEVTVELDNQARDHRLRLKCSPAIRSHSVKSQGHFGILERPLRAPPAGKNWAQPPPKTFPFREWLAVDDGQSGLALACRGLYEYEARATPRGVDLYVTLLRGIGQMSRPNLRTRPGDASPRLPIPQAQCLGFQRFEYAFIPYTCVPGAKAPFRPEVDDFLYPAIAHWQGKFSSRRPATLTAELFQLEPANLVISCFKRAQDGAGYILRFWENEGRPTMARLRLAAGVSRVFLCNLNEKVVKPLPWNGETIKLKVAPYKIITLKLKLREKP